MSFGRVVAEPVLTAGGGGAGRCQKGRYAIASISCEPNGRKAIRFKAADGIRKWVRLGKTTLRHAQAVKARVEELNAAVRNGVPIDDDTAAWLRKASDGLREKLAAVGLADSRRRVSVAAFIEEYIAKRTGAKPRSRTMLKLAAGRLLGVLDGNQALRDVTPAEADACLDRLRAKGYAPATIGATIKRARQFFRAAVRARLIPDSPFEDVKPPPETNAARKHFIDRAATGQLFEACPNGEWRLLVALARWGGLRMPSEPQALEWSGVNWERDRFWVPSPKTEGHAGKSGRWVPIFPELRPHLEEAWERAPEGAQYVVSHGRRQGGDVNLRTGLRRIILKAGLKPWPRLWQNLRASRETELAETFPLHVVCEWIGNSARVAAKHYLQVTEADYGRAATAAGQNPGQQNAANGRLPSQPSTGSEEKARESPSDAKGREGTRAKRYPRQDSNL